MKGHGQSHALPTEGEKGKEDGTLRDRNEIVPTSRGFLIYFVLLPSRFIRTIVSFAILCSILDDDHNGQFTKKHSPWPGASESETNLNSHLRAELLGRVSLDSILIPVYWFFFVFSPRFVGCVVHQQQQGHSPSICPTLFA